MLIWDLLNLWLSLDISSALIEQEGGVETGISETPSFDLFICFTYLTSTVK